MATSVAVLNPMVVEPPRLGLDWLTVIPLETLSVIVLDDSLALVMPPAYILLVTVPVSVE